MEYEPAPGCTDRAADLQAFLDKLPPNQPPSKLARPPTNPKRPEYRCICFRSKAGVTGLPEKCGLHWDCDPFTQPAPGTPNPAAAQTSSNPPPKSNKNHGLLYPLQDIPLDGASVHSLKSSGHGFLYLEKEGGHWEDWEFCSALIIKAKAEARDEVGGDPEGSLLLNALEGALEDHALELSLSTETRKLLPDLPASLLDYAQQETRGDAFDLRGFFAGRNASELHAIEETVNAWAATEGELDEETVERVRAALRATTAPDHTSTHSDRDFPSQTPSGSQTPP